MGRRFESCRKRHPSTPPAPRDRQEPDISSAETEFFETNRRNWDERAGVHLRDNTGFYRLQAFKVGADVLGPIEAAEIGDVRGKRVIHLQCHFGLDTLCLARRGAEATGLDFSPAALAGARGLAAELGIAARFVEANLYDARAALDGIFDLAYVTWGAINWLPDIRGWAAVVASLLGPGGALYLAESHPSALILEQIEGRLVPYYPWRTPPDRPLVFDEPKTYTGDETPLANNRNYSWVHPLSDILGGLIAAGLRIEFLHEHQALPWRLFPMMVPGPEGMYRLPDGAVSMPLAFSLMARKPG